MSYINFNGHSFSFTGACTKPAHEAVSLRELCLAVSGALKSKGKSSDFCVSLFCDDDHDRFDDSDVRMKARLIDDDDFLASFPNEGGTDEELGCAIGLVSHALMMAYLWAPTTVINRRLLNIEYGSTGIKGIRTFRIDTTKDIIDSELVRSVLAATSAVEIRGLVDAEGGIEAAKKNWLISESQALLLRAVYNGDSDEDVERAIFGDEIDGFEYRSGKVVESTDEGSRAAWHAWFSGDHHCRDEDVVCEESNF